MLQPGELGGILLPTADCPYLCIEGRSNDGEWRCLAPLDVDAGGALVIRSLELRAWDSNIIAGYSRPIGMSTNTLRSVPLGRWLAEAHVILKDKEKWLATGIAPITAEKRRWAKRQAEGARSVKLRRGRLGYPADHYRRIALRFLELQRQGKTGRTGEIQRVIGKEEGVEWQTIRDWMARGTELGFLAKGTPGRSGRLPGPRLYEEVDNNG